MKRQDTVGYLIVEKWNEWVSREQHPSEFWETDEWVESIADMVDRELAALNADRARFNETLRQTGIAGIYDTFNNPADAISQMAQHIKELTAERNKLREVLTDEQVCTVYPTIEF